MNANFSRNAVVALIIVIAVIGYGSLFPFAFHVPTNGIGPFRTLLETRKLPPERGDFLVNVALYLPLGFFGSLMTRQRWRTPWQMALAVSLGAILSIGIELTQYYDQGRVTSANDVYANVIGTTLGALGELVFGYRFRWPVMTASQSQPFPTLLLASWLGYRLYPFEPSLQAHKYLDALKPIFLHPELPLYDFCRYTIMWVAVAALIESATGQSRSRVVFPIFAGGALFAKLLVVTRSLALAEIMGAATGYCIWLALIKHETRQRAWLVMLPLLSYVIAWRLEPFEFASHPRQFGWIPFYSLMNGSIEVNTQSLLEKSFYYGSLIWLSTETGLRIRTSTALAASVLFVTSYLEMYLPDRSAESTDAVMAVTIGLIAWYVKTCAGWFRTGNSQRVGCDERP